MESNPLVHFSKTMCTQHNSLQIFGKYSLENSVKKSTYLVKEVLNSKPFWPSSHCSAVVIYVHTYAYIVYCKYDSLLEDRQHCGFFFAYLICRFIIGRSFAVAEFQTIYSRIFVFTGDLSLIGKLSEIKPLLATRVVML